MIVAEKMYNSNRLDEFETEMQDGRLTEPSDGKIYKLREAILASKKLGGPLIKEEMKQFAIIALLKLLFDWNLYLLWEMKRKSDII